MTRAAYRVYKVGGVYCVYREGVSTLSMADNLMLRLVTFDDAFGNHGQALQGYAAVVE